VRVVRVKTGDDWKAHPAARIRQRRGMVEQLETIVRLGFDRRSATPGAGDGLLAALDRAPSSRATASPPICGDRPTRSAGAVTPSAETVLRFNELALAEGIGGIFYSIPGASRQRGRRGDYAASASRGRRVLEALGHGRS